MADLGRRLLDAALLEGDFLLRSGRRSRWYLDKYRFETDPAILRDLGRALAERIAVEEPQAVRIAGPELGAVALAASASMASDLPFLIVRGAAKGSRANRPCSFSGDNIPARKETEEYAKKNEVEKTDLYLIRGGRRGRVIGAAIGSGIKKAGGKVPADIKAFRKSVRDEMEALKDFDTGGITPPFTFKDHQGSVQARVAEIKDGKYAPVGTWINAR